MRKFINVGTIILNFDISIDDLKHRFVLQLPPDINKDFEMFAKSVYINNKNKS